MPLRTKKWTRSKANQYISRARACKKLQIALPSFRKLCILKGIYPHDPKKKHKKEGDRRVYYHVKDIKNLRREPILWQWRNQRTFRNKITKHKGRHSWEKVKKMQLNMPQISIDHLVRERYPTFNDALRDLDDCVTFMFLFSSLPSGIVPQLTALRRIECQKLCKEFRNYIIHHGILTKSFISVKGIYYQCRFKNKYNVTFVIPHNFAHSIPNDVDYRVMSSFLDFYQTMFKFVIFKLYKMANMNYPPFGIDIDYDLTNLSLTTLRSNKKIKITRKINWNKQNKNKKNEIQSASAIANDDNDDNDNNNDNDNDDDQQKVVKLDLTKILKNDESKNGNDDESKNKNNNNKLEINLDKNSPYSRKEWSRSNLFEDFKFLLRRETPQIELEFVILAMGGKVIFEQDCSSKKEKQSPTITHEVIDRKISESSLLNTREYIQPQWIFDCLNTGCIIPTEHYQIGIQCPPHLSPFINYNDQSHKPSQAFVLEHWQQVSKQFGGFVPSKKLKKTNKNEIKQSQHQKEDEDEEEAEEEEIGMNLDIEDIMDIDEEMKNDDNEQEEDQKEEEVEEEEEEEEVDQEQEDISKMKENVESKQSRLQKQRLKIAHRKRVLSVPKEEKHSLDKDGIPGTQEEWNKVNRARAMMPKRHRKMYDKIRRSKTKKSKHFKYMEQKRKRFEQKQMHSKH